MTDLLRAADPHASTDFSPESVAARSLLADILNNSGQASPTRHTQHAHRGRTAMIAASIAAAAATVVAINVSTSSEHTTQALGPAGYRITTRADGAVKVVVRWNEVKNPAALQASLDQAQAHTKVWVTTEQTPSLWCRGIVRSYSGQLNRNVVQYNAPGGGSSGLIIRPRKFPAGVTLLLTVQLSNSGATDAPRAPDTVSMAGYGAFWAVGPTADCA